MFKKIFKKYLLPLITAVLCVLIPYLLITFGVINGYTSTILISCAINAIMALSVNIICGITGQLSLGQAGFMAIGAYSTIIMNVCFKIPLPISIIIAVLVTAIFGFLIGFPTLKLDGDYLAIVTLGFGEIIRVVLNNLRIVYQTNPEKYIGGPNGNSLDSPISLVEGPAFFVITTVLILLIVLVQNFIRSSYGRAILAVREDEIAANANGISVFKYKMIGFVIASIIAGLGGALYVCRVGFIKPDQASFTKSIDYLIFVVLGGMGSTTGSILAAYVLTYLQEALRFLNEFRLLIYPIVLIIVMIFRPQGLLGTKEFSFEKSIPKMTNSLKNFFSKNRNKKVDSNLEVKNND